MTLRYREQDSTMTLEEGLDEYFRSMPNLLDTSALEGDAKDLFTNHDVAHVVFGCDTSLRQEALVDLWTMLGADIGFFDYLRYLRTPEAKGIIEDVGIGRTLWSALRSLPDIVRVIVRALRMKKKWPWRDHDAYMARPLHEIRAELGVAVIP